MSLASVTPLVASFSVKLATSYAVGFSLNISNISIEGMYDLAAYAAYNHGLSLSGRNIQPGFSQAVLGAVELSLCLQPPPSHVTAQLVTFD